LVEKEVNYGFWINNIEETTTPYQLRNLFNKLGPLVKDITIYNALCSHIDCLLAGCVIASVANSILNLHEDILLTHAESFFKSANSNKLPPRTRKNVIFTSIESMEICGIDFESNNLLKDVHDKIIELTLNHYQGHRQKTADSLGIPRRTLLSKLNRITNENKNI